MTEKINTVSISLLNRSFNIKCPESEKAKLIQASSHLNEKMESLNANNKESSEIIGFDKILMMAAINVAYDFINLREQKIEDGTQIDERLIILRKRIEEALAHTYIEPPAKPLLKEQQSFEL